MLITVNSITGIEHINPDQITHIDTMRDSVLIHFTDQAMAVVLHEEWEKVKERFVCPSNLEERYYDMLNALYRQSGRIEELEAELYSLKHPQSDTPASADDLNGSTTDDYGGF